jgi:hypothetical protein
MTRVRRLTSQNPGHFSMEQTMLLSIELSRERMRDMERRLVARHPAMRAEVERRGRQEAATEAVRLSSRTEVREIGHPIRRLLARFDAT